ncbi:MAG: glycerol-3-phosphate acyltransferase [Anaerolineae bacterium]|nr:glycerol-3-phosphate acyltransferase [Anaerolineae bacterium]
MDTQTVLLIITLSYVIGSFPTAYIVGRLNGFNIFNVGSGNMGTTNVLRALGLGWGAVVFLVDISKGILAVWLARQIAPGNSQASASAISAVAVVTGHNWSFIASLISGSIRGGKGAATAGGTWLIIMPAFVMAIPLVIMALIIATTRYMSLGVLVSTFVGGLILLGLVLTHQMDPAYLLYALVGLMVFYRHRDNIKRLLAGNERRLGERAEVQK